MIGCREREVKDCCLKSCGVFYFSNVWWDHIPDAICLGVKRNAMYEAFSKKNCVKFKRECVFVLLHSRTLWHSRHINGHIDTVHASAVI